MFNFCRSCGSGNIKVISEENNIKKWQCEDCLTTWNEIKYEQKQDESEFVTGPLQGADIIRND